MPHDAEQPSSRCIPSNLSQYAIQNQRPVQITNTHHSRLIGLYGPFPMQGRKDTLELTKREIGVLLRVIEERHVFKTADEFNALYELWQKLQAEYFRLQREDELNEED